MVFGRFTPKTAEIGLPVDWEAPCKPVAARSFEILVADPKEPILLGKPVVAGDAVARLQPTKTLLGERLNAEADDPTPSIVLAAKVVMRDLGLRDTDAVPQHVCVNLFGWHKFRVAAIVNEMPPDLDYAFGGMLAEPRYIRHSINFSRDRLKTVDNKLVNYSRAAVYYDQASLAGIKQYLENNNFVFNRDFFSKFSDAVDVAGFVKVSAYVLIVLILSMACIIMAFVVMDYMKKNAKPFAVLKAHGCHRSLVLKSMQWQLAFDWAVAVCLVVPALALLSLTWLSKELEILSSVLPMNLVVFVLPFLVVLLLGWLVSTIIFGVWWWCNPQVAEILKQGD